MAVNVSNEYPVQRTQCKHLFQTLNWYGQLTYYLLNWWCDGGSLEMTSSKLASDYVVQDQSQCYYYNGITKDYSQNWRPFWNVPLEEKYAGAYINCACMYNQLLMPDNRYIYCLYLSSWDCINWQHNLSYVLLINNTTWGSNIGLAFFLPAILCTWVTKSLILNTCKLQWNQSLTFSTYCILNCINFERRYLLNKNSLMQPANNNWLSWQL